MPDEDELEAALVAAAVPEFDTDDPTSVGVISEITGSNVHPNDPQPCPHVTLGQQVVVAVVPDGAGGALREAKLKLRCESCGVPVRFEIATARSSLEDGDQGLVCRFSFVED